MAKNTKTEAVNVVDLDEESSIGVAGAAGKVVSVAKRQAASSRRSYDESPKCPHCDGRMHMNLPAATVNFECLWRQYNLTTGGMSSADERLPVFTASDMDPFNEWIKARARSRKSPLTYGKMDSSGGGAATYAMAKAASTSEEDKAAAKEAAKAARATKTGAKTGTIKAAKPENKAETPAQRRKAAAAETVAAKPKPSAAKPKATTNGKASKDFTLDDISLDYDDEPVVVNEGPVKRKAVVRSAKTATVQKPAAGPAKAAGAKRRASALESVK